MTTETQKHLETANRMSAALQILDRCTFMIRTVAILAQGTLWAVALAQAFFSCLPSIFYSLAPRPFFVSLLSALMIFSLPIYPFASLLFSLVPFLFSFPLLSSLPLPSHLPCSPCSSPFLCLPCSPASVSFQFFLQLASNIEPFSISGLFNEVCHSFLGQLA